MTKEKIFDMVFYWAAIDQGVFANDVEGRKEALFEAIDELIDTKTKEAVKGFLAANNSPINLKGVSSVEVIDQKGRSYTNWNDSNKVSLEFQDKGMTLKVFIV